MMDIDPSSSFGGIGASYNELGSGEKDHVDGEYWSLLPEGDRDLVYPSILPSTFGPPGSASTGAASTVDFAGEEGTPEHTPTSSSDGPNTREGPVDQVILPLAPLISYHVAESSAMPVPRGHDHEVQLQQDLGHNKLSNASTRSERRVTERGARRTQANRVGRPRALSPACIFETYVSHETKKDNTPLGRACIINAMKAYQTAILEVPRTVQLPLALLATSIGDSSALLLLKEAVQALRSPDIFDYVCIARRMSVPERVQVIGQVGACTALLRLVRWLHIVTLWEDLSREAQDGSNRFVIATLDSVAQHTTRTTRKGNPLSLAKADVAQGLLDSHGTRHDGSQYDEAPNSPCPRLRHLGQRLGLIVRKWGQASLLTLGQSFSERR